MILSGRMRTSLTPTRAGASIPQLHGWQVGDPTDLPMNDQRTPNPTEDYSSQAAPLTVSLAGLTDVGKSRSNNEDNFVVFDLRTHELLEAPARLTIQDPGILLAVADGMGGHNAGQVASQLCVANLPAELLKALPEGEEPDWHEALIDAIGATNRGIFQEAHRSSELQGMGTTLTVACLTGNQAWVAQVGDSRAYLLHEGRFVQLTQDQTVLNSLQPAEREAFQNSPLESMLLQAVGAMIELDVVVTPTSIAAGDSLLLCSDGLYRVVTPQQMAEVLSRTDSPEKKARSLIDQANKGGGPDNVTVIICEISGS